jgi:dolichol-phosphate mannosyltransferase
MVIEMKNKDPLSTFEGFSVEPKFSDTLTHQTHTSFAISLVIPTRNEAGNIEPLLSRIDQATMGIPTEVVFVDDSTDNTPQVITELQGRFSLQVVLIARPPERRGNGLGGAVVEGFRIARAPWICVMDADLQHPPELIPQILKHAALTETDVVVGSRLAPGGDASSLGHVRNLISHTFALMARAMFPVRLRNVTDPLSGFFIIRRAAVDLDNLRPSGFKILLEMLIRFPELRVSEMPIHFGHRNAGQSKASVKETVRFFRLLLRLRFSGEQSFLRFLTVGASGLVVNNLVLAAFTELAGINYLISAAFATQASTLWNFGLTEKWVFTQRAAERPFFYRLFSFLLMNNLLLLLRGPMMAFMVSQLGVHYLVSNLISLIAIMVFRYLVADRLIWSSTSSASASQNQTLSGEF